MRGFDFTRGPAALRVWLEPSGTGAQRAWAMVASVPSGAVPAGTISLEGGTTATLVPAGAPGKSASSGARPSNAGPRQATLTIDAGEEGCCRTWPPLLAAAAAATAPPPPSAKLCLPALPAGTPRVARVVVTQPWVVAARCPAGCLADYLNIQITLYAPLQYPLTGVLAPSFTSATIG